MACCSPRSRTGHDTATRSSKRSGVGSGGQFDLPTGTVYPALHRLERAGLVRGTWSPDTGRRRRVYQLTRTGRRALESERSTWRQFASAVTALLDPTSGPATP